MEKKLKKKLHLVIHGLRRKNSTKKFFSHNVNSLTLHGRQVKENDNCFSGQILSETKTARKQYE